MTITAVADNTIQARHFASDAMAKSVVVKRRHLAGYTERPWAIVVVIMGAILFAYLAAGRGPDRDTRAAVLTALREIDFSNSALQRDVLQARAGLLNNYDPLVASIAELHERLAQLNAISAGSAIEDDTPLRQPLARLSAAIEVNESLVEKFKTKNAILQNSLGIFSRLLADVPDYPPYDVDNLGGEWRYLGALMLRFSIHPDASLAQRIHEILNHVPRMDSRNITKLQSLALHGEMILTVLPAVDDIVSDIQSSDASERTQDLQRDYLAAYDEIDLRAAWSRLFLGAISVILCLYVLFLVYRLRFQTDRLTRRLKFETSRNVIKAHFDNVESADCIDAIRLSLDEIAASFEATRYELIIFNVETEKIEETYDNSGGRSYSKTLLADYLKAVRARSQSDQPSGLAAQRFYRNLQSPAELVFTRDALSAGAVVGTPISDRYASLVILEYPESRPRAVSDEVALMRDSVDVLIRCIDRVRKNQEHDLLEHRLEHAERLQAVGTLAAGIAHEFNNILGSMLGYAEMTLQLLKRPSPKRDYVQQIVSAGERARMIIDQILTLSRKRERNSKPFSMEEAISTIVPLLQVSLPEGFELNAKFPAKPLVVVGNPIEIQQIVMNLCKNAVEAADGVGKIEIEISSVETRSPRPLSHGVLPAGSFVRLSVADTGAGIPEAVLAHIFEPFFTTKSHAGGTGLGLAAVHGNIVAHAGHINVSSELGRGTRFDIFFPLSRQPAVPLRHFFEEEAVPLGSGETVLLLEKESSLRLMHEEKLAALAYEPYGFVELEQLLKWREVNGRLPDLAILDVASIREDSSIEELDRLLAGIPYILILDRYRSGALSNAMLKRLVTLRKPINSRDLANAIHRKIASA